MSFQPKYNFIEELKWRHLFHQATPKTEERLNTKKTKGYIGFDPTADSLHIGNFVPIILLMHLQRAGHQPYALVGGATGMVGDPSGKKAERQFLNEEVLQHNQTCVHQQLEKFLDFKTKINPAKLVNNYDWFSKIGFLDFIRDIGKHISISYMMSKDSVKNRLDTGLSFTEFTYQMVQGYDFYHLYKNENCVLQLGGSDQWGNITTGIEIIRRKLHDESFAFTAPLITKADGSKFGKSESGNIWLDENKTSVYNFYQFWLNISDEDAQRYVKIFTFLSNNEIKAKIEEHQQNPGLRKLQKLIAQEVTSLVHSPSSFEKAKSDSEIIFGLNSQEQFEQLADELVKEIQTKESFVISKNILHSGDNVLDLMVEHTQIFPSKGEAKRMIKSGGVKINFEKIVDEEMKLLPQLAMKNKYILINKGKKNKYLVKLEE